ncbi:hypothetical protein C8R46DRAFT_1241356 [Mycena filopes]|nr:hypothetical protein C8R46DRAFT_1241356 [Mycena filopes]
MHNTSATNRTLERGGACTFCRKRKVASIARLERRILQLGGTLPTSPEVVIHEPHLDGRPFGASFSSWNAGRRRDYLQAPGHIEVTLPHNWWQSPAPPHHVAKILLDVFARHASQFGFFLNGPRIMRSVCSPDGARHPISPPLLNAILLFGIHLSGAPALHAREPVFLERANIQAEVLLAQYFLRQGRFVEAMHRINSAASLAIGIFSVMMQWPSSVSDMLDEQIDLPWPLGMDVYESGIVPINPQRQLTLKMFLENPAAADFEAANSCAAQYAKAAALFARASQLGGNRTTNSMPTRVPRSSHDPDRYAQFILFEHGLAQFIQTLASFESNNIQIMSIDTLRQRVVTFTLCQVAVIQLHGAREDDGAAVHKCLAAARAVVALNERVPGMRGWEQVDSSMGTLWVAVCQIIICGLAALRDPQRASRGWAACVSKRDYTGLKAAFASVTGTMGLFSPRCLLVGGSQPFFWFTL